VVGGHIRDPAERSMDHHSSRRPSRASRSDAAESGVSLVELMIGVVIATVVLAAGYTVMGSSEKAATVNDQTAQLQQNARVAMDLISNDLKTAGFGFAGTVDACSAAVVPADNNVGGKDTGPDRVSLVVPVALSTLAKTVTGPTTTVTLQSGAVAAMSPEGFGEGAAISINGVISGSVAAISGDALSVSPTIGAPAVFPIGTQVYWLRCLTYQVIGPADANAAVCEGTAPCLVRGVSSGRDCNVVPNACVAVAEGIEDLQLAYACDGCRGSEPDGMIDDQNASNTFDEADFVSDSTWSSGAMTTDTIRLVRINVVARQTKSDTTVRTAPRVVEDHNPLDDSGFALAAYQPYRRRVLTRVVQVRNLGL
jgi:type IV pilus assembly protein PilW